MLSGEGLNLEARAADMLKSGDISGGSLSAFQGDAMNIGAITDLVPPETEKSAAVKQEDEKAGEQDAPPVPVPGPPKKEVDLDKLVLETKRALEKMLSTKLAEFEEATEALRIEVDSLESGSSVGKRLFFSAELAMAKPRLEAAEAALTGDEELSAFLKRWEDKSGDARPL